MQIKADKYFECNHIKGFICRQIILFCGHLDWLAFTKKVRESMIIQSSKMNLDGSSSFSRTTGISTSFSSVRTTMGIGGLTGAYARFNPSMDRGVGKDASHSRGNGFQDYSQGSFKSALIKAGEHKEELMSKEASSLDDTNASSEAGGVLRSGMGVRDGNTYSKDMDWHKRMTMYLLEYVEYMREAMMARLKSNPFRQLERQSGFTGISGIGGLNSSNANGQNVLDLRNNYGGAYTIWQREITVSHFTTETESMSFSATGSVKTADGREIDIDVKLNMSREFTEITSVSQTQVDVIMTDPLVFQVDDCPLELSDTTFVFDIDCDGVLDEISELAKGNAFLALDTNGDGVINDGSELFGTKSGDGFYDLAAFDDDGNGWIDENDSVFDKLTMWSKDQDGNDVLRSLKVADVGAIFLGHSATDFSLNSMEDNSKRGEIRSTGMFLKESGGVGTVSQVDMVKHQMAS